MAATTNDARLRQPLTVRLGVALVKRLVEPAIDNLVDQIEGLGRWTRGQLDSHDRVIQELTARVSELEQRQMVYRGVWTEGETYAAGDLATDRGCLWYCFAATTARPGGQAGGECWQLTHKSHR